MTPDDGQTIHIWGDSQGPCVAIERAPASLRVIIDLPNRAIADGLSLLSSLWIAISQFGRAVNDNARLSTLRQEERDRQRARQAERARRLHIARSLGRLVRRRSLPPPELSKALNDGAYRLQMSRPALVSLIEASNRKRDQRLKDMRRAHAYRWKREGLTGAEIGQRLGISAQAANRLVRLETERRNRQSGGEN
jgi:hypothetical protein